MLNLCETECTSDRETNTHHIMLRACPLLAALFLVGFFRVLFALFDLFSAFTFSISSGLELTELLLLLLPLLLLLEYPLATSSSPSPDLRRGIFSSPLLTFSQIKVPSDSEFISLFSDHVSSPELH